MARRTRRQIGLLDAFWDASALVPLCKAEPLSQQVVTLYNAYQVSTWWATPVEMHSALARLKRLGQLDAAESAAANKTFEKIMQHWVVVSPSHTIQAQASSLLY